jgi:hypothetical protein
LFIFWVSMMMRASASSCDSASVAVCGLLRGVVFRVGADLDAVVAVRLPHDRGRLSVRHERFGFGDLERLRAWCRASAPA